MPPAAEHRAPTSPRAAAALVALALLLCLAVPGARAAEPSTVEIGNARLAANGSGALLIPVRYPIQLAGQRYELRVSLRVPGRGAVGSWVLRGRASAGAQRSPERRRRFTFVHRVDLDAKLARQARQGFVAKRGRSRKLRPRVGVYASAVLDIDRDGDAEVDSDDRELQPLRRAPAGRRQCATPPLALARPGGRVATRLPACGSRVKWRIAARPEDGAARIRRGRLVYHPRSGFRGTDSVALAGRVRGAGRRAARRPIETSVQVKVGSGQPVVRAIGDSVTAGFGYYDNGSSMPFTSLLSCKPPSSRYDDACSSNSSNRSNEADEVVYAPDYGLANNVSWVAQWANEHGVTDYANYAVSGSEPSDWLPKGQFYSTTKQMEAEDPDYVLLTMGANPLLSEMLFGVDNMGCAIWSDLFGDYQECVEEAFAEVQLRAHLEALYRELVDNTEATIYLMQYHLSIPASALAYSSAQIATMGLLLNQEIAAAAEEVGSDRLQVVAPPHFDVGIDISPAYPSEFTCSSLGFEVDGPSVQSTPTQDELRAAHLLSFCPGPPEGPPWVISGDTGIHPSAAGYAQMASQLPAPE